MSGAPTRIPAGFTQDNKFQPLGGMGIPNPFFATTFEDDFLPYNTANYTVTAVGGSIANTSLGGAGGRILLTTGAVVTNFASLQLPAACFSAISGTKLAFLCRMQFADVINSVFQAGLIQTTVTPLTVTNGIYFQKSAASTNIVVSIVSASVVQATATLTGLLVNNADIDLGFFLNRNGALEIYAGAALVGNKWRQNFALLGPQGKILAPAIAAYPVGLLNPTLNVAAGTGVLQTAYSDFLLASQER